MKKLLVTVKPFQGTILFRILQRGRVLVEGSFSGKCTQLHSRTFQVNATNEELTVECTMNAAKCRMVSEWPDALWHVSWRLWDLPVFSGVKRSVRPSAGKPLPQATA